MADADYDDPFEDGAGAIEGLFILVEMKRAAW
jgi:hypothetical protein